MTAFSGALVVTADSVLDPGMLIVDDGRITDVRPGRMAGAPDLGGRIIVPGFVDVHVHGVDGFDTLTTGGIGRMARSLPKYGVTAFCPTSIACAPGELRAFLAEVRTARTGHDPRCARVLPAHLESNFINADYCGAQPRRCLRQPADDADEEFSGADVLREIANARSDVGIVTLAPELPGALDLIRALVRSGHRVSLGHSGATYEEGLAGVHAGACHATHLFNRMPAFTHRAPGLVGAVFDSEGVTAELIADGHHIHPAVGRAAIRLLGRDRAIGVSDGTAVSGLPPGTIAQLGSESITAGTDVARLGDGTWAGSVATMAAVFRNMVRLYGCSLSDAARLCSTNPARLMGLPFGTLEPGASADFVVLGPDLTVLETFVNGASVFRAR